MPSAVREFSQDIEKALRFHPHVLDPMRKKANPKNLSVCAEFDKKRARIRPLRRKTPISKIEVERRGFVGGV